ncbi:hypothetical protein ACLKMH_03805 [Psychromonas sp. KJ10-10]|uniref:hypothetical protein n=1 Tax=Psychromonas sp. KJ10-10 TaxID=3391823 RepID=UPI0039B3DE98
MKKLILPTLIISLIASPLTWAKGGHHDNKSQWKTVTKVQTITHKVEHRTPQVKHRHEPMRHKAPQNKKVSRNKASLTEVILIAGVLHALR